MNRHKSLQGLGFTRPTGQTARIARENGRHAAVCHSATVAVSGRNNRGWPERIVVKPSAQIFAGF
jgi:hypothetical protein